MSILIITEGAIMRLKVDLKRITKYNKISINYSYKLAAAIYWAINRSSRELSEKIHKTIKYKYFTFSLLNIPKRKIINDKIMIQGEDAYFYVSSPDKTIIKSIAEGFLANNQIDIDSVSFRIKDIKIYEGPNFQHGKYRFSTLSPIVLRTIDRKDEKRYTRYLYVTDDEFYTKLRENLIRRYTTYYNKVPEDQHFEITKIYMFKPVKYMIKNTFHRGNRIVFDAVGSPELLKFAYESGLGEKTAMGFGMLKVFLRGYKSLSNTGL